MSIKPRVRFAPSPTGPLHIGGVRTALYNYLFARKHGGDFILRIEDTDQTRFVPGAEEYIIEALKWSGINYNEGVGIGGSHAPYRQSERKHLYRQYADRLLENGYAYYAFDTPQELDEMRERLKKQGVPSPQYDAVTRQYMKNSLSLSEDEVKSRLDSGQAYVIRLKMPRKEEIRFEDMIRGWVSFHSNQLDDKVLFKSDGMPTYHLANVVDDHLMEITHVIRGEEWLPSAPLHVLLYRYLGWEETMPQFAHLPLILKPDGHGKLSKRDGDRLGFPVFPLNWKDPETGEASSGYRERGFFPEAFVNMLAFLGWNPGTSQEIFTMDELVQAFSIERVGKSGAKFDFEKAKWFNHEFIKLKSDEYLADLIKPMLEETGITKDKLYLVEFARLMKERVVFINDFITEGYYFFKQPVNYDEKTIRKKWNEHSRAKFLRLQDGLEQLEDFSSANIESNVKAFMEDEGLKLGDVLPVLRMMLTGTTQGPPVFDMAALFGKNETLERMAVASGKFEEMAVNS